MTLQALTKKLVNFLPALAHLQKSNCLDNCSWGSFDHSTEGFKHPKRQNRSRKTISLPAQTHGTSAPSLLAPSATVRKPIAMVTAMVDIGKPNLVTHECKARFVPTFS